MWTYDYIMIIIYNIIVIINDPHNIKHIIIVIKIGFEYFYNKMTPYTLYNIFHLQTLFSLRWELFKIKSHLIKKIFYKGNSWINI